MNKFLLFILCILLLPLPALSATPAASDAPIKVEADRLEVDDRAQSLVFIGNAVASQGDVTIHGERMTIDYAGSGREVEKVTVEGAVRIVQGTRVATGEKAVLYRLEERVILSGHPRVSEGDNFIRGQEITLYLKEQRSVVSGGESGRVNALFKPRAEAP